MAERPASYTMAQTSTKQLVEIADIQDSVVLLKNGSLRAVIEVSAINFELRSEPEQIGILQNFQNFLNSIDFPLQMAVNSRQLNMDEYLKLIDETVATTQNELMKIQGAEYSKFIKELLELSHIMSKKFYIVLPFYIYEAPTKTGIFKSFKSILNPAGTVKQINKSEIETYRTQLMQRTDLVVDGLVSLGLKTTLLEQQDLLNVFYALYNPGEKPLSASAEQPIS